MSIYASSKHAVRSFFGRSTFGILVALALPIADYAQGTDPTAKTNVTVSGSVAAMEGAMIPGAQVRVIRDGAAFSNTDPDHAEFATTTDTSGRFTIAGIDPGTYRITASADGYLRGAFGSERAGFTGRAMQLRAGEDFRSVNIKLFRQGIIEGRVVDANGDPVASEVHALVATYINGERYYLPGSYADTNTAGEFTLRSLQPGTYVVSADPKSNALLELDKKGGNEPRRTYYPNSPLPDTAVRINIAPGSQIRGIGIKMTEARSFSISGKVQWAIENTLASGLILGLLPCGHEGLTLNRHPMTRVRPDNTFTFRGVYPGTYCIGPERIQVNPQTQAVGGKVVVAVSDANVEEVKVPVLGLSRIVGTIRSLDLPASSAQAGLPVPSKDTAEVTQTGQNAQIPPPPTGPKAAPKVAPAQTSTAVLTSAPVNTSEIDVLLLSLTGLSINLPRVTTVDQTFFMKDLPPDRYAFHLSRLPENAYVAKITFDGRDVTSQGIELMNGDGGEVEVTLSGDAARISGNVTQQPNSDGREVPVSQARVSVWRTDAPTAAANQLISNTTTDQSGSFVIANLPPGNYRVIAWEEISASLAAVLQFCQQFENDAEKLVLEKKSQESVRIHPISANRVLSAETTLR